MKKTSFFFLVILKCTLIKIVLYLKFYSYPSYCLRVAAGATIIDCATTQSKREIMSLPASNREGVYVCVC
jgi:hypothetical protein